MLTRLREIVEKVTAAPRLSDSLDILVNETCQAMNTEVCSVYLADNDRRCYYLMATRGLNKPRGRTITLAFDQGIVDLVGRLAEPINLADAHTHPSFKYIPAVKEERFRSFLGVLVVQQREHRQFDESEESFMVTLATQMAGILSQSQLNALFSQYRQTRSAPWRPRRYAMIRDFTPRRDSACAACTVAAAASGGRITKTTTLW